MNSKHSIEVFKIATTTPGRIVSIVVRYPTYRPRGFVLEVETYEEANGRITRTFSVGGPSDSREVQLAEAKRFNARKLEALVNAVRTTSTPERAVAEREYRAFMETSGLKAQFSPFGDA